MKNIVTLVLAAWLSAFGASALAEQPALEFKGWAPGVDATAITSDPAWQCKPDNQNADVVSCVKFTETIAGARATAVMVKVSGGFVAKLAVMIDYRDYRQLRDALIAKFGAPDTVDVEVLSDRKGTKFNSEHMVWMRDSVVMSVRERIEGIVPRSIVTILSKDGTMPAKRPRVEQTQGSQNDL